MRLIDRECKHGDVLSGPALIGRGLDQRSTESYAVLKDRPSQSGSDGVMETPVPIPNTEVKHHSGDDSQKRRQ